MGKRAKSLRHIEKMKKRREEKKKRAALYASQAGTGKSKRGAGSRVKKGIKVRDIKCQNIGDINTNAEHVVQGLLHMYTNNNNPVHSRYKRELADALRLRWVARINRTW